MLMKKNVLVIWYSQTGQLTQIVKRFCAGMDAAQIDIDYCEVKPVPDFEFPWKDEMLFYSQMPVCVGQRAVPLTLLTPTLKSKYDAIIQGFQPWFLHPSVPTSSIFADQTLRLLFKDTPVVTIIGARNMWLNAHEIVKEKLIQLNARLIGHIALVDQAKNLASVITVQRWMFQGKKEATFFLPKAGISEEDIQQMDVYGQLFSAALLNNQLDTLHASYTKQEAVTVKSNLVILERTGVTNFRKFAKYIDESGTETIRIKRLRLFVFMLSKGVFLFTPISSIRSKITGLLQKESLAKDIQYFKGIEYQPNRF